MVFGKYVNRFYIKYGSRLLLGLLALAMADYMLLVVPWLYQMVINGINQGGTAGGRADAAF